MLNSQQTICFFLPLLSSLLSPALAGAWPWNQIAQTKINYYIQAFGYKNLNKNTKC